MNRTYPSNLTHAECETPPPLPTLRLRCPLVSVAYGLPLALPTEQFSAVADGVLSLAPVLPHRALDTSLQGIAGCRTSAGRQGPKSKCGQHGCPVGRNRGGVRVHPRRQMCQTSQASFACGYPGHASVFLCHPCDFHRNVRQEKRGIRTPEAWAA
jgi:hypothetical protein